MSVHVGDFWSHSSCIICAQPWHVLMPWPPSRPVRGADAARRASHVRRRHRCRRVARPRAPWRLRLALRAARQVCMDGKRPAAGWDCLGLVIALAASAAGMRASQPACAPRGDMGIERVCLRRPHAAADRHGHGGAPWAERARFARNCHPSSATPRSACVCTRRSALGWAAGWWFPRARRTRPCRTDRRRRPLALVSG